MALSLGGLGVLSLSTSFASFWSFQYFLILAHIRSLLFATFFLAVALVVAYHTNPSESSFRTFLTEQSFRRQLSRLNNAQSEHQHIDEDFPLAHHTMPHRHATKSAKDRQSALKSNVLEANTLSRFHFNGHASISLRTPAHIFRSFGILTIAAVTPITDASTSSAAIARPSRHKHSSPVVPGYWFIGAFGRWWAGGVIPLDGILSAKDEEDSRAGILSIRSLKASGQFDGLPAKPPDRPAPPSRALRLRDRSGHPSKASAHPTPHRSSTPPPLPQSASLPLHDKRQPVVAPEPRSHVKSERPSDPPKPVTPEKPLSPQPEQSAAVAELLKELATSQTAVNDLRAKIEQFQTSAQASRENLQRELDAQREQKRREDASRSELKARTRALEDSKRHTESVKREAEKRLKAAQAAQEGYLTRIARLNEELASLQEESTSHDDKIQETQANSERTLADLAKEVEAQTADLQASEETISKLSNLSNDLEARVTAQTARLEHLKQVAEKKRQERLSQELAQSQAMESTTWPPPPSQSIPDSLPSSRHVIRRPSLRMESTPVPRSAEIRPRHPAAPSNQSPSFLGSFNAGNALGAALGTEPSISIGKGYSIFNSDIQSLANSAFSPFGDIDNDFVVKPRPPTERRPTFPGDSSYVPSTAFNPLDLPSVSVAPAPSVPLAQSRTQVIPSASPSRDDHQIWSVIANSRNRPISVPSVQLPDAHELPPLGSGPLQPPSPFDMPLSTPGFLGRSSAQAQPFGSAMHEVPPSGLRPALSPIIRPSTAASTREKTGLNPDAKVFNPPRHTLLAPGSLTPNPSPSTQFPKLSPIGTFAPPEAQPSLPSSGTFFSSLRAFAPSPAEREALSRALGAGNGSRERLVGGPHHGRGDPSPSPPLGHAIPASPSLSLPVSSRLPGSHFNPIANGGTGASEFGMKWKASPSLGLNDGFASLPSISGTSPSFLGGAGQSAFGPSRLVVAPASKVANVGVGDKGESVTAEPADGVL